LALAWRHQCFQERASQSPSKLPLDIMSKKGRWAWRFVAEGKSAISAPPEIRLASLPRGTETTCSGRFRIETVSCEVACRAEKKNRPRLDRDTAKRRALCGKESWKNFAGRWNSSVVREIAHSPASRPTGPRAASMGSAAHGCRVDWRKISTTRIPRCSAFPRRGHGETETKDASDSAEDSTVMPFLRDK